MARTSTKTVSVDNTPATTSATPLTDTITRAEYEALMDRNNKLEEMLNALMEKQNEPTTLLTPIRDRMDTPITIVHMCECDPMFPTTFILNGITHYFTTFGETKEFPWRDVSHLLSANRNYFVRGVLALGKGSEEFKYELPSDIKCLDLPDGFLGKMAIVSVEEFKHHFGNLSDGQKAQVAHVWKQRYFKKMPAYNNMEIIKFLNKETDGMMKAVIEDINNSEK